MGVKPAQFVCDNECGQTVPMTAGEFHGWISVRPLGALASESRYFCSEFCLVDKLTHPDPISIFEFPE